MQPDQWLFSVQYAYTEEFEQQRGKGSFPAHLTPGYKVSKKASEQASEVSPSTRAPHALFQPLLISTVPPTGQVSTDVRTGDERKSQH